MIFCDTVFLLALILANVYLLAELNMKEEMGKEVVYI
jgi:hypothetical protein